MSILCEKANGEWICKGPTGTDLDYWVDWRATVSIGADESVASSAWSGPDGVTIHDAVFDGDVTGCFIDAPTAGSFEIRNTITTNSTPPRTAVHVFTLTVR